MRPKSILVGLALLCAGCRNPATHQEFPFQPVVSATNAFSLFAGITNPVAVPIEVKDLQGGGYSLMDTLAVSCRFRAPAHVLDSILAKGYQQTNWNAVAEAMHIDLMTNGYSPKWDPDSIQVKECYFQRVERHPGSDELHLVVDRRSGLVYAVGVGGE
jgi:hypothetical protein